MAIESIERDSSVREFAHLVLKLRDDLKFTFQNYAGEDCYVVEDPVRSKFFRVGVPEYRFIARFDGRRSVADVVGEASRELGEDAFGEHESIVVVDWLLDSELVTSEGSARTGKLLDGVYKRRDAKMIKRMNVMFMRVPLFNPDRILSVLRPLLGWMLSGAFAPVWFAVVLSGAWQVFSEWDRFVSSSSGIFTLNNWLQILLVWTLLKLVHETFHGLACKRYGGEVPEAGVIMILFAPIGYVDATSSWRFNSKWQRMHTACAGMYVEFLIAGIAAWIWVTTSDPAIAQLMQNIVMIASINTLVFNANPLMKFDGYYIFADWLEIPNLYGHGQHYMRHLGRRYLLGMSSAGPDGDLRKRMIIAGYGVSSFFWRIIVVATLLIVAHTLFHGAGVAVAVVSGLFLIGIPAWKFIKFLATGDRFETPSFARFAISIIAIAGVTWVALDGVKFSSKRSAPAVMDYADVEYVRAGTSGFVTSVTAKSGDRVSAGDVLVTLENPDLEATISDIGLRIESLKLRRRIKMHAGDIADAQADQKEMDALRVTRNEHKKLRSELKLTANIDGTIMSRGVAALEGRFVDAGDSLIAIADDRSRELRLSIAQSDVASFRGSVGESVELRVEGAGARAFAARLESIEPRASTSIHHDALTALGGGPLDVRANARSDGYELTEARFPALVSVMDGALKQLEAGRIGSVSILAPRQSLGVLWYRKVSEWVDRTIEIARATRGDSTGA